MTNDESKLYYQTQAAREDPMKLNNFKSYDEQRDEAKEDRLNRYYARDEL